MNRKIKNQPNNTPTSGRLRRGFSMYAVVVAVCLLATPVLADGDPLTVIR